MAMFLIYQEKKTGAATLNGYYKGKAIAFFSDVFPRYTETLSYREYLQLEKFGVHLVPIALKRNTPGPLPNEAIGILEKTQVIRQMGYGRKLSRHLLSLISHPILYPRTLLLQWLMAFIKPHRLFHYLQDFWNGILLVQLLRQKNIEHVHVHHVQRAAAAALVAHRMTGIPYSLTVYASDLATIDSYRYIILKNAAFIVCLSQRQKKMLLQVAPDLSEDNIKVLRPGVDLKQFSPRPKTPGLLHQYRLLTVTKLTPEKGLELLLHSCKILDARGLNFEAIIIGEGPEKERLQAITNEMRLNHRIRFSGARRMEEIIEAMARADLFVYPFPGERGSGADAVTMPMIEAMAMGIPIITTPAEGIQELVDETTGRLIKKLDAVVLADTIEELLTQSFIRTELGEAARKRIEKRYNLEKNAKHLMNLFGVLPPEEV